MKKSFYPPIAVFMFLLLLIFTACSQSKIDKRTKLSNVSNSKYNGIALIQSVKNKEDYGTGFFVGKDTLLINKHVVGEALKDRRKMVVRVVGKNNKYFDYKISKIIEDPKEKNDLAIVKIQSNSDDEGTLSNIKPLNLATNNIIKQLKKNDTLYTVGYPGDKPYSTLWKSKGIIKEFGDNFVAFSAFIEAGNSGSPIFNESHQVVGLSNASNGDKENPITYGFLLQDELINFVKENI